ncbi:c-type cytochrome [Kiloniella laminariae]|uniref:c-type cytochrome n=1 Tax=Kiloniella laminariae TaxID=454162 RepID=UPI0003774328|nr:cytochrome c family protein [Kiloniella laminariae]
MARNTKTFWGIVLTLSLVASAAAAADVDAGKKVFNKCKACHAIGKSKIGPDLAGIINRPAASIEGFKYSDPMQNSGLTWTEENLATFLKKPKALVPGTRMSLAGLKKDEDIQNLIAYLKEATVP